MITSLENRIAYVLKMKIFKKVSLVPHNIRYLISNMDLITITFYKFFVYFRFIHHFLVKFSQHKETSTCRKIFIRKLSGYAKTIWENIWALHKEKKFMLVKFFARYEFSPIFFFFCKFANM